MILWIAAAVLTAASDALGLVDLYVLLGAAVVVPRAAVLLGWPLPPASVAVAGWAGLVVGLTSESGPMAGLVILPWVATVTWTVARGLWPWRIPRTLRTALPAAAGAWAVVGATFAALSGWGRTAFGINEPIVRLTAVHYLVAGMGATTLAWRISRDSGRPGRVGAYLTAVTPPVVALGFVTSHPIPQVGGAILLTIGVYLVAAAGALQVRILRGTIARLLQAVSSVAVVVPMILAIFWAAAQHFEVRSLSIPDMAKVHGTLNGIGFTACGLTAWLLQDRRRARDGGASGEAPPHLLPG